MKNRVRITSRESIVTNAKVELLGPDDEYVDVSRCVTGVHLDLRFGEVSRCRLDLVLTEVDAEAFRLDDQTIQAMADVLTERGFRVRGGRTLEREES